MSDKGLERIQRPLTSDEQELILWLIEHGTYNDKAPLLSQIDSIAVCERCTCGCPTVYFALSGKPISRREERIISDHLATVDGNDVGVMLFETDGILSSLEVYSCAGSDQLFGLPEIKSIIDQ